MIDILRGVVAPYASHREKQHRLREYLQEMLLKLIEQNKIGHRIGFVGGTALRILFDLNRFSEDLDFSLLDHDPFDFQKILETLKRELVLRGFAVELTRKEVGAVKSSFIKFRKVLFDVGLSPYEDEKLSVKFEIDTNPPPGFKTQTTLISKSSLIEVVHFDRPSLFAGKCNALLCRTYAKGRDYYDLLWYVAQKIVPNYLLIENGFMQTQHQRIPFDFEILKKMLLEKIQSVDFEKIRKDVEPFLIDPTEIRYFEREKFIRVVDAWSI